MSTQEFLLSAWSWHPAAAAAAALIVVVYAAVWERARKSEGRDPKAERRPKPENRWQFWCLMAGVAVFLLVLVSPVNALADGYLFSAHMLQHLVLLLIVPPLLLLAWPARTDPPQTAEAVQENAPGWGTPLKRGVNKSHKAEAGNANNSVRARAPETDVRTKASALRPVAGWLAGVGAMWLWHAPALCNAAVSNHGVRSIQVISLLALGGMFWWPIVGPRRHQRLAPLAGVLYLFTACVACTLLGIIITFAPVSVCSIYMHPADRLGILPLIRQDWGFSPAVDQQVGGLLMWVPACTIYLCGIMALLARWYAGAEPEPEAPHSAEPQPARP